MQQQMIPFDSDEARPRFCTKSEAEAIVAMYLSGVSFKDVARRFGRSDVTVINLVRKSGNESRLRELTPAQSEATVSLYSLGLSIRQVATEINTTQCRVRRCLEKKRLTRAPCRYTCNESFFENITTEKQAWVLGLLSADGCVYRPKARPNSAATVEFGLKKSDAECVETVAQALEYDGPIIYRTNQQNRFKNAQGSARFQINSNKMAADLEPLGVTMRKSLTHQPWQAPPHLMPHYARGLIEGDGGFSYRQTSSGKSICVVRFCGSEAAVKFMNQWINRMIDSRVSPRPQGKIWTVGYCGVARPRRLVEILYDDASCYLLSKKAIADQIRSATSQRKHWTHRS